MATYKSAPGTNGSFAMDKFVPTIWSSRIYKNLHDRQILAQMCSREWEGESNPTAL